MKFFAFLLLGLSSLAHAYPELVLQGYNQCTACHVSPSGGYVLSDYGRELSTEVLTQWGKEGEAQSFQGLYEGKEWFKVGGHFRALQLYVNNPNEEKAVFFPMQGEITITGQIANFVYGFTEGVEGGKDIPDRKVISPQHWIQSRHLDKFWVRAGRFDLSFGLNNVNHTAYTEESLYFGPGLEPYGVEFFSPLDQFEIQATYYVPAKNERDLDLEKGASLNFQVTAFEGHRFGFSAAQLEVPHEKRQIVGVSGLYSIGKTFVLMHENDMQWSSAESSTRSGSVHFVKLDSTFYKGWHAGPVYQLAHLDQKNKNARKESYGLDVSWFPRPHFDFMLSYRREDNPGEFDEDYDKAYLILHYWL